MLNGKQSVTYRLAIIWAKQSIQRAKQPIKWVNGNGAPPCSVYTVFKRAKRPFRRTVPIGANSLN